MAGFACPAGKAQAFLWDSTQPGLGLRVTPAGKPAYIFQSEFQGRTLRATIGSSAPWSIPKAQERARELQRQIYAGRDPRRLTGARREELAGLRWADADFQRQKLTIADKVEATRVIPLTPYLAHLISGLPRFNEWVFASVRLKKGTQGAPPEWVQASASGRLAEPRAPHTDVLADAGIPHVSIHGLRRTFSLLGEASGAPAGAIAQVMGHKPSAIAEGYRPRSIDALRPYLAQIEAFILAEAGVVFDTTKAATGGLRLLVEKAACIP